MFNQQSKSKVGNVLLLIISIIGVLLIGGGVFGYFYFFQETPEKIIEKMGTRVAEVKTVEYQGDITGKANPTDLIPFIQTR